MLSLDARVLVLLCSHLGISPEDELSPLTLREWNPLARKIKSSSFTRLQELLGQNVSDLQKQLGLTEIDAERLVRLLSREDRIEVDIRRLGSQGISIMTRADEGYPRKYLERLHDSAPMVLFYSGEPALLGQPGIAVVGSRHLDQAGQDCATFIGNTCGYSGLVLYSGGAKGVDTLSMHAALEGRGSAVAILADSLEKAIRPSNIHSALVHGDLCLASTYLPDAGFSVGAAMGRNRLIYCLADYAIVVASDADKGGTWAGATEALKAGWLPVFVLDHPAMPEGNRRLIVKGGIPFPYPFPEQHSKLPAWLKEHSSPATPKATQLGMF